MRKNFLQRHISFASLHKQTVNPLSFFRGIHAQVEICSAHGLRTIRRHIVPDEDRFANLHARVHNRIFLSRFWAAAFSQVAIGLAIGIPAAIGAGKLMTQQLFSVRPWDPVMLASATFALGLAALLASALPAWRAAGVEPMVALRNE